MAWLLHEPAAAWIVGGATATLVLGEVAATVAGTARRGGGRPVLRNAAEALVLVRRRDGADSSDRGTVWIVSLGARAGILAALAIGARVPALRAGADTWATLWLGAGITVAGVALRAWAIVTLGPWFRRRVTIEPGQRLVRRGPYRILRHPSYAGLVLACAGLGLAFGSWVGAAVAALAMVAALVPRIRVEERALQTAFGPDYAEYARSTARLVPGVW